MLRIIRTAIYYVRTSAKGMNAGGHFDGSAPVGQPVGRVWSVRR